MSDRNYPHIPDERSIHCYHCLRAWMLARTASPRQSIELTRRIRSTNLRPGAPITLNDIYLSCCLLKSYDNSLATNSEDPDLTALIGAI